jgi:hypothetical protein
MYWRLDLIWISFGSHLDLIWISFGSHLDLIWISFGSHLDLIWISFECLQILVHWPVIDPSLSHKYKTRSHLFRADMDSIASGLRSLSCVRSSHDANAQPLLPLFGILKKLSFKKTNSSGSELWWSKVRESSIVPPQVFNAFVPSLVSKSTLGIRPSDLLKALIFVIPREELLILLGNDEIADALFDVVLNSGSTEFTCACEMISEVSRVQTIDIEKKECTGVEKLFAMQKSMQKWMKERMKRLAYAFIDVFRHAVEKKPIHAPGVKKKVQRNRAWYRCSSRVTHGRM